MMTQPQDATQLVSGMAPALTSRLSIVPQFFANLLQEMLPLTQSGADPAEVMLSQSLMEKGEAPAKGKSGILSTSGRARGNDVTLVEQSSGLDGSQLTPLLALAGQPVEGQPQTLPSGEWGGDKADDVQEGRRQNTSGQAGEESCATAIPFLNMPGGVPQLPVVPGATGTPLVPESATAARMAQGEAELRSVTGRLPAGSTAHETLDASALLDQTRSPAQREAVSTVMTAVAETGPALIRIPIPAAEGRDNQHGQQPGQSAASQPPQRANQTVEAAQTTAASVPREGGSGHAPGNQAPYSGVQLPLMAAAGLPPGAGSMLAASPSGEARAVTHASLAERIGAAESLSKFSAVNPSLQEGLSTRTLPDSIGSSASPTNPIVEVLFTDPSARERSSSGKEENGATFKQNEQDGGAGFAVPVPRATDMPLSNRFNLQPKLEETRNALHGSILEQVTASVVSHDSRGNGSMTVRLNPHELGELQVNVRIENQHVKVEIVTANQTVREALMGNLENLKETFLKQNLTMERFDVSSGAGNGFGQGFREERDGQRQISPLPFGQDAASFGVAKESGDDWGETENLLVNLRL